MNLLVDTTTSRYQLGITHRRSESATHPALVQARSLNEPVQRTRVFHNGRILNRLRPQSQQSCEQVTQNLSETNTREVKTKIHKGNTYFNAKLVSEVEKPKNPTRILLDYLNGIKNQTIKMPEAAVKFNFYMEHLPPRALEFFKDQMQNWYNYLFDLSTQDCEDEDLKITFRSKLKELDNSKYDRLLMKKEVQLSEDFESRFEDLCKCPSVEKFTGLLQTFEGTNSFHLASINNRYLKAAIERSSAVFLTMVLLKSILVDQFNSTSENYLNVLREGENGEGVRTVIHYAFAETFKNSCNNDGINAVKDFVFNKLFPEQHQLAKFQPNICGFLEELTIIHDNKPKREGVLNTILLERIA